MSQRIIIYTRSSAGQSGTESDLLHDLRQVVEDRGNVLVAAFVDNDRITTRGKYQGWRALLAGLDQVDEVVVATAGDLPGRTVSDLLKVLETLRDHDVGLHLHHEQIATGSTSFALLDLIAAYRRAKLSAAIKAGQAASRKKIGRPTIPPGVLSGIQASLSEGSGIRPTARKFRVSPASVINIRRTMMEVDAKAA